MKETKEWGGARKWKRKIQTDREKKKREMEAYARRAYECSCFSQRGHGNFRRPAARKWAVKHDEADMNSATIFGQFHRKWPLRIIILCVTLASGRSVSWLWNLNEFVSCYRWFWLCLYFMIHFSIVMSVIRFHAFFWMLHWCQLFSCSKRCIYWRWRR